MPAKEIKELRQSGKLDEALSMSKSELQAEPTNIWAKRNLSWVYYDLLKQSISDDNFDTFIFLIAEINLLNLPTEEAMFYEKLNWQIGKMVFVLIRANHIEIEKIIQIHEAIKNLPLPKPSESYSFLYKAFHKALKETESFLMFADWWDFKNFRIEDFQKEKMPNGKEVMSIAEQAYISYARHLLPKQVMPGMTVFDKEKAELFLPVLDNLIENHPQFQYPLYYKAKILLALGEKEKIKSVLLPFVKRKKDDFWVWELLGEAYFDNNSIVLACYCKALSCNAQDEMLVNLRQKMATIFINQKLWNEARTEIELIVKARQTKNYRIPNEVLEWQDKDWYKNASVKTSNIDFYKKYLDTAEELIFKDLQQEVIIVEFVNNDKKILNFISHKNRSGFFAFDRFIKKIEIGDKLLVRMEGSGTNTRYKVLTLEKTDLEVSNEIIREFKGKIHIGENQLFGHVDNVFIEPRIIEKYNLSNGIEISGTAIISFNKKKNDWGWKAIKLN